MRFLLILWLFTFVAVANMDLYPKKECELFNNLKHTKNRGHEVLKLDRTYEMLKHHKGQYLLKVEYATPVQRWVNDDCLTLRPLRDSPLYPANQKAKVAKSVKIADELSNADTNIAKRPHRAKKFTKKNTRVSPKQNLLALSWHNAFCETHRYKKECKRSVLPFGKGKYSEKHFVLHGLWPQPKNNVYCNVEKAFVNADKHRRWRELPCLAIDEEIEDRLEKVMPGFASDLHKHEWVKHGTCYGTDPQTYFEDAVLMVEQMNASKVGVFFTSHIGKGVTLKQVRAVFDRSFGVGTGKRVELKCRNGLVTELWLHLGSGSDDLGVLLKKGKKTRSRCQKGRIDKAGFGR